MGDTENTNAAAAAPAAEGGQVQEVKAETKGKSKKAAAVTGNFIADTAAEIENYTKAKALKEAMALNENIDANYFRMGGVLMHIKEQGWFDEFESFGLYVYERFGFKERKADYLIGIYKSLVNNAIPWEKVAAIGWTKLKDLAPILTQENVDDWVDKASKCTVIELQALINAKPAAEGSSTTNASDGIETMKFKLKPDQKSVVETAINKAKAEVGTEFDTSALEAICGNYVNGGQITVKGEITMDEVLAKFSFEDILTAVSEKYPEYDITAAPKTDAEETGAAETQSA